MTKRLVMGGVRAAAAGTAVLRRFVRAIAAGLVAPGFLAALALLVGSGLAVAGVFLLAGAGWACITGAVPLLLIGFMLLRGVVNVQ